MTQDQWSCGPLPASTGIAVVNANIMPKCLIRIQVVNLTTNIHPVRKPDQRCPVLMPHAFLVVINRKIHTVFLDLSDDVKNERLNIIQHYVREIWLGDFTPVSSISFLW